MTFTRIRKPVPNQAPRNGVVRLIVLHITAGALTNESLYNFISQASAQVSYHVSVDNGTPDMCFWYVEESPYISWSVASYNQVSVNGCICAPGEAVNWTRQQWLEQGNALSSLAQWVRQESDRFGIPLVALSAAQAQGSGRGVCQHRDLGVAGGGHSDCGVNFPMDELLRLAKGDQPVPVPPPVTRHGEDYEPMQLRYGPDGKCAVEMPKDVIALRLGCSQGGTVNVQWPGKSDPTRTYDLSGYKRQDVPTPTGTTVDAAQTGQCIIYRPGAEANPPAGVGPDPGPVSATWVAK